MARRRYLPPSIRVIRVFVASIASATAVLAALARAGGADDHAALARELAERAQLRRGVCAGIGLPAELALEIAKTSDVLIHVREPRPDVADALRQGADRGGLGVRRIAVEEGGTERLPYADGTIDAVFAHQGGPGSPAVPSLEEMLRVLRPRGKALVLSSDSESAAALMRQARERELERVEFWGDTQRSWVEVRKPALEGADDWSHWEHGPDNNPVSADQVIRAPYLTQYLAGPLYIGMPSITTAAAGRLFLAVGHIAHHEREWDTLYRLIARNGYNGAVLWERKLPEGYLVHRSAFIAAPETFYMIDGDGCLLLDPETGAEKGRITLAGVEGHWKWMAMKNGVLYVLLGEKEEGTKITRGDRSFGGWSWADLSPGYYGARIPHGFGHTVAAYDPGKGTVLWSSREHGLVDSRGMAVDDEKVYLYSPERHLRALSAATGEVAWTNDDRDALDLIEMPGRGLRSTPGFRTACLAVLTPEALIIQGQTRMNVIAVSTSDGYFLWSKKKVTNNPNAIYVDGKVILGVGEGGRHVALDPRSGEEIEDLGFHKAACTRLTASEDSFFCRGEGTLRYDRESKTVLVDGGVRPACNDGAIPANGLLYIGPWQCDCNLSLIGQLARCSAGEFRFDHVATEEERLVRAEGDIETVGTFEIDERDWPTERGDIDRSGSSPVRIAGRLRPRWTHAPDRAHVPSAPIAAGDLVLTCGDDGRVRAIDARSGSLRWQYSTWSTLKAAPTVWEGRAFIGGGDGSVHVLEAATGRLLWRFRAAPVERHIMVHGAMSSTWPVHSGVLVRDGVAYFAAGIIDSDGTYVYALDARTGAIRWQNNSSGHLDPRLRKGVSAHGNLTVAGDRLLLAGGNQVSPAPFDLETGKCLAELARGGAPRANAGRFVGVFGDDTVIAGGRILHSAPENVPTKGSFDAHTPKGSRRVAWGGIPPAWNDDTLALVNFKHGKVVCCDAGRARELLEQAADDRPSDRADRRGWMATLADALVARDALRWSSDLGEPEKFEAVSLAVAPNAVVIVARHQERTRAHPQWSVAALDAASGAVLSRQELPGEPLPGGLLVDRRGQVVVAMLDGRVSCFGRGE